MVNSSSATEPENEEEEARAAFHVDKPKEEVNNGSTPMIQKWKFTCPLEEACQLEKTELEIGKEARTLGQRQKRFTENDHHGWGAFTAPGVSKEKSMSSKQDQLSSQLGALVGPPPRLIKSELAWSAQRANLSEKNKFLKTVKGMLNKLTPEKLDLLKGQLMECGITTPDILKAGLAPSIKSEVPWSTKRGNLSEKDQILKALFGSMLNKLMPEKFDLLKGQLLDSGTFTADILKDVISLIYRRTEMLNFAASYIKKIYDPMIATVDSDPVRNVLQIGEVSALEKLTRYVDDRRVPVYFLRGSRAVNVILGRNLDDQFTREAFQFSCPDSHPFLRESKRTLCQEHSGFEIHKGMEDYVDSKLWDLYLEYENMQELYDQIVSKRERNSPTSNDLWETIDDGVERCRTIRRQIRAAGGASHDIPPHLIRWD